MLEEVCKMLLNGQLKPPPCTRYSVENFKTAISEAIKPFTNTKQLLILNDWHSGGASFITVSSSIVCQGLKGSYAPRHFFFKTRVTKKIFDTVNECKWHWTYRGTMWRNKIQLCIHVGYHHHHQLNVYSEWRKNVALQNGMENVTWNKQRPNCDCLRLPHLVRKVRHSWIGVGCFAEDVRDLCRTCSLSTLIFPLSNYLFVAL